MARMNEYLPTLYTRPEIPVSSKDIPSQGALIDGLIINVFLFPMFRLKWVYSLPLMFLKL